MFEEMRWLEYSQRLASGRRGCYAAAARRPELAATLLGAATAEGAAALGVDAGALAPGAWADFALLDLDAPARAGAEDVLGAAIFGGSAEGLVLDTCVAGRWTKGGYA